MKACASWSKVSSHPSNRHSFASSRARPTAVPIHHSRKWDAPSIVTKRAPGIRSANFSPERAGKIGSESLNAHRTGFSNCSSTVHAARLSSDAGSSGPVEDGPESPSGASGVAREPDQRAHVGRVDDPAAPVFRACNPIPDGAPDCRSVT